MNLKQSSTLFSVSLSLSLSLSISLSLFLSIYLSLPFSLYPSILSLCLSLLFSISHKHTQTYIHTLILSGDWRDRGQRGGEVETIQEEEAQEKDYQVNLEIFICLYRYDFFILQTRPMRYQSIHLLIRTVASSHRTCIIIFAIFYS